MSKRGALDNERFSEETKKTWGVDEDDDDGDEPATTLKARELLFGKTPSISGVNKTESRSRGGKKNKSKVVYEQTFQPTIRPLLPAREDTDEYQFDKYGEEIKVGDPVTMRYEYDREVEVDLQHLPLLIAGGAGSLPSFVLESIGRTYGSDFRFSTAPASSLEQLSRQEGPGRPQFGLHLQHAGDVVN